MKYEDYSLLNFNIVLFILSIMIIISISIFYKINIFSNYKLIYYNDNTYQTILSDKELKDFYKNSTLYINNKKYSFKIDRINKNILKKDNTNYNEIFIIIKNNKYKTNDIVDISILKRKVPIIEIFTSIYK